MRLILLLTALFACGCVPQRFAESPAPSVVNWAGFDDMGLLAWQREASASLHKPVAIIACHGGDKDGEWYCFPKHHDPMPVENLAALMHEVYRTTPVVLIVCNEGGAKLDVPNVWYAREKVWSSPGMDMRWPWEETCAGKFSEFVEGGK